jgi:hypothetical protein
MFKKILIVLMVGCFLLGMATKAEVENVKEEAGKETGPASTAVGGGKAFEPDYQISAASVSKVAEGDTITHVIYGEAEMTVSNARSMGVEGLEQKGLNEKVKVKYPKVVMVSEKRAVQDYGAPMVEAVKFFDLSGKVKKEVLVKDVFPKDKDGICWVDITDNRQYFALYTHVSFSVKNEYQEKKESKSQVVVFDTSGNKSWEIEETEFPIAVHLSPNGEYLVGAPDTEWGGAPVLVYNKSGKMLKKVKKDDQGCRISFSNDGSYFAVVITKIDWELKTDKHYDRISSDLVVVDAQGNELWRKEKIAKGVGSGGKVKISNDVISVITGVGECKVYYFDKNGKLLKTEQGDVEQLRNFKH